MTKALGTLGEEVAVRHLEALGYRIVETELSLSDGGDRLRGGRRGTLVFVEVKARRNAGYGGPLEAVDERKRRRMIRVARQFVHERRLGDVPQRFDVVAVWMNRRSAHGGGASRTPSRSSRDPLLVPCHLW